MIPKLRHFPVRTDVTGTVTTYTAVCGYTSDNPKEFVDPRGYKVEKVLPCCQTKKGRALNDEG